MVGMAGRAPDYGETAKTVAGNVVRLRGDATWTQLSERLRELADWNLTPVALKNIEDEKRRVTVDDLAALAVALNVSPITLLMPMTDSPDKMVQATGMDSDMSARRLWLWLIAAGPLFGGRHALLDFLTRAVPAWLVDEGNGPAVVESGTGKSLTTYLRLPYPPECDDGDDQ